MRRNIQCLGITLLVLFTLVSNAYAQSTYQYLTAAKTGKIVFAKRVADSTQSLTARAAIPSDPKAAADRFIEEQAVVFGARSNASELKSQSVETDSVGMTHVRYHQRKHRPNHTVYTGVLGGQPVFQLAAASSTKISAPPFAAGGL